jgi:predicted transcriptional regulator
LKRFELPDIGQIKQKRIELGITQKELANLSGVGQPIISRIEDRKIAEPSYSSIQRIFQAFNDIESGRANKSSKMRSVIASDIMNNKVISIAPSAIVQDAWALMKKYSFSQLPVIDQFGTMIGRISEASLLRDDDSDSPAMAEKSVKDVMADPFPTVGMNTPVTLLADILRNTSAVIIVDRGKTAGIVTRYDLIEHIYGNSDLKSALRH